MPILSGAATIRDQITRLVAAIQTARRAVCRAPRAALVVAARRGVRA